MHQSAPSYFGSFKTKSNDEEGNPLWQRVPVDRLKGIYDRTLMDIILEQDMDILKDFLVTNYDDMIFGMEIQDKLMDLIKRYSPSTELSDDMFPATVLKILEDFLENCERRLAIFDITLEGSMLEGTALQLQIDESRRRISEYLQMYGNRLREAEDNVNLLHELKKEDARQIEIQKENYNYLFQLISEEDRLSYKEFYEEMQKLLDNNDLLNSTFEELAAEKRDKHSLLKEMCRLQELRIHDQQQNMLEVSELAKDLELDKTLTKAILEKIKTFTANPDEIRKAVHDWISKISLCIGEKEEEIRELKESVKFYDNELVQQTENLYQLDKELNELKEKIEEETEKHYETHQILNGISDEIMELDWQISEKNVELRRKQQEVEQLEQAIQGTGSRSSTSSKSPPNVEDGTIYSLLSAQREMFQELPQSSPKVHGDSSKFESPVVSQDIRPYSPKSKAYQPDISDSSSPYSGSFKSGAKQLSPVRKQAYFGNISPISKESPTVSSFSDTSSSPFQQSSPLMQSYSEKEAMVNSPRRAFSSPSHRLTRDPTTQNINQVRNRIDIGKSFNMRTVCQTSSPYHQNTRVESILPESGGSDRMINNPLNIKHTAELSPTQYVTPFISKTRFDYTDPTAGVFNIPPGDDIDIPTELRTSSPSTSPKYFGPNAKQQIEDVSTVITHDSPPAVTPTTTRRHGLFTPKGIFRRRHFNVRKLYRPGEYQSPELPWSPQYLPRDYRSPIRSIPSTPTPVYADQSLSWENSPDYSYSKNRMNQTYKASPILSETYRGDTSYATSRIPTNARNRNFNASTLHSRNRTFATAPPYIGNMNRIFSVSPTDRNFARSTSYSGDRTFAVQHQDLGDRDRTFSRSPTDRNFARSTSYSGDRTFAVPPQDLGDRDRTFSGSPTDRNFARSTSY